jgi:transposase
MEYYVGLDVSLEQTSICVVNQTGSIVREGVVNSDAEAIAAFVTSKAPGAVRIGLVTGPTATWLWTELKRLGLPMICIDARHAKAVLKMQINKSDRNDAAGIARIMQTGWFKEVRVKDLDSHAVKALLASRALLVKIKRDLENQVRGLLKNFGLVIGRAKFDVFAVRADGLVENRPELAAVIRPLLEARKAIEQQVDNLDRKVLKLARHDVQVRRFMTVPGIGPITALCFKATIDDPTRFKRSRSVGAYVGLTTRRHASGEIDWSGRISKCGDARLRMYLFEAAGVLLTRVPKWSGLKAWGAKLTKRNGLQGQGRRRAQARGYFAPHVDRRNRVQLVDEEDCRVARIRRLRDPATRREKSSLPGRWRW